MSKALFDNWMHDEFPYASASDLEFARAVWSAAWDARGKLDVEIAQDSALFVATCNNGYLTEISRAIRTEGETKLDRLKDDLSIKGAKEFIEEVKK